MTYKMIYLAGPITGVGEDAKGWRESVMPKLKELGYRGIDPLVVEAATITPQAVVQLDYAWIEKSSAILARVDRPSWGTAMELVYAHHRRIPVVGWGDVPSPSPWLSHHLTVLKPTLDEALDYLKGILS